MEVDVLSERRVHPPYGMAGGQPAERVRPQLLDTPLRRRVGGKAKGFMNKGDRIVVITPGGGRYGKDPDEPEEFELKHEFRLFRQGRA